MVVSCLLALLILLNLGAAGFRLLRGGKGGKLPGTGLTDPGDELLQRLYPDRVLDEIYEIRENTLACRPTGPEVLHPPAFASPHVNLSEQGYRMIADQRPFKRDASYRTVFVFGGSTAWGYGVADGDTVAAHLQRRLDARTNGVRYAVFNYGVCASYSKYELRQLQRLIQQQRIPSHVVFIDGLNDFCRLPLNRPREDVPPPVFMPDVVMRYVVEPVVFWQQAVRGGGGPPKEQLVEYSPTDIQEAAALMVTNWRMARALCREFGMGCTLVLQPVPVVGYDLDQHLFLSEKDLRSTQAHLLAARSGYEALDSSGRLAAVDHLDLRGLTIDGDEYLDSCHYTPPFSAAIAERIAEDIE